MVPQAPPAVTHPPVLRPDWEIIARLTSTWSKPLDLDMCPTPSPSRWFCDATDKHNLLGFEAQTKKPPQWFWGPNHQTVAADFEGQIKNPQPPWFWGSTKKPTTNFEAKSGETVTTDFEVKPEKTVSVVLKLNHWQTVDLGFEAQPRNSRSSSPRTRCRPHTTLPNLPIVRPSSTRHVRPFSVLYTKSLTPATILVATRHTAPTTYTSWDKQIRFFNQETKIKVKQIKLTQI
jgi:hypothetical protein